MSKIEYSQHQRNAHIKALKPCLTYSTTPMKAKASNTRKSIITAKRSVLEIASNVLVKVMPLLYPGTPKSVAATLIPISGGWDPKTGVFNREINAQIDRAFENVDLNLKDAGGKGWSQVFRVNSYHVPLNNEAIEAMVKNFGKWMPNHKPIWTCVGVTRLGEDDMRVEIEVVAHDDSKAEK